MLYKLNNLTGRVVRAGQSLGQGLKSGSIEPAPIVYGNNTKFAKVSVEGVSQSRAKSGYGEVPPALKKKMEHFQVDDGVPIHIKGGTTDKVLFGITLLACAAGIFESFRFILGSSFPKKE